MVGNKAVLFWLVALEVYTDACAVFLGLVAHELARTPHSSTYFTTRWLGIFLFGVMYATGKFIQWDLLMSLWRDNSSLAERVWGRIMGGSE